MIRKVVIDQVKVVEAIEEKAAVVAVIKFEMVVETITTINESLAMILVLLMADTNGENTF